MTDADLAKVHDYMQNILEQQTGYKSDALYYCSDLAGTGSLCRKPCSGHVSRCNRKYDIALENFGHL